MSADPGLVLASASPRRAELLALTGWGFERCGTDSDESQRPGESPRALALRLATSKAKAALQVCEAGSMTLAADTLVVSAGNVLGKPHTDQDALHMLQELRARQHTVITAIALQPSGGAPVHCEVCETIVPMRAYTDMEIVDYVASGSPFDKAGAYGIQDAAFEPADLGMMSGCYANVMGLPICHFARAMRGLGFTPPVDIPGACRSHTGYDCDVYPRIEKGEL